MQLYLYLRYKTVVGFNLWENNGPVEVQPADTEHSTTLYSSRAIEIIGKQSIDARPIFMLVHIHPRKTVQFTGPGQVSRLPSCAWSHSSRRRLCGWVNAKWLQRDLIGKISLQNLLLSRVLSRHLSQLTMCRKPLSTTVAPELAEAVARTTL